MTSKSRDSYRVRQRKLEDGRKQKVRDCLELQRQIDRLVDRAIASDAYHTGEVEALTTARHAVASVRGGYARRRK